MYEVDMYRSEPWKGLVAGLAAGLVATWTMTRFQSLWSELTGEGEAAEAETEAEEAAPVKAATAVVMVEIGPPSMSVRFLAMPGHNVPHPVYMRPLSSRPPSCNSTR